MWTRRGLGDRDLDLILRPLAYLSWLRGGRVTAPSLSSLICVSRICTWPVFTEHLLCTVHFELIFPFSPYRGPMRQHLALQMPAAEGLAPSFRVVNFSQVTQAPRAPCPKPQACLRPRRCDRMLQRMREGHIKLCHRTLRAQGALCAHQLSLPPVSYTKSPSM